MKAGEIYQLSSWRKDSRQRRERKFWEKNGGRSPEYLTGSYYSHAFHQIYTLFLKRFLLFVFSTSSFVATICCIMMSPHFPDHGTDEGGEDDVFDQPDDFEELLLPQ